MPTAARTEGKRRRRSREEAEQEILDAAADLLRVRPLHQVSVSAIMAATTLSRKSFYVYFRDRYDLLTRLFEPLRRELDEANSLYFSRAGGDLVTAARESLKAVASFCAGRDGPLVKALHEASAYDPEAGRVWREFNEPVIAAFAADVRREIDAGRLEGGFDLEATIRVLVGMNLYAFFDQIVGHPDADVEAISQTLHAVWARTFGVEPAVG